MLRKKTRQKIYLTIAERIAILPIRGMQTSPFVCDNLANELRKRKQCVLQTLSEDDVSDFFPEFYLFKPDVNEDNVGWWEHRTENSSPYRATALLLCAEMCR